MNPKSDHAAPDQEQSPLLNTKEIRLGTPVHVGKEHSKTSTKRMNSTDKHKSSTGTSTGTCTDDTKPKTKETDYAKLTQGESTPFITDVITDGDL